MPEPLLNDDQLVGEWDPEARLWTVTGWVAGPAGTAAVDAGGVELDVDVADPSLTSQLLVEAPGDGDAAALPEALRGAVIRLLGDARADTLFRLAAEGSSRGGRRRLPSGGPSHRWRPGGADDPRREPDPEFRHGAYGSVPRRPAGGRVSPRLSGLALAGLAAGDADLSPAGRAVALLEAAVFAADLPADLGLASTVAADSAAGTDAVLALGADAFEDLPPRTAFEVAALLRRAARLPGAGRTAALELMRLATDLQPRRRPETDLPALGRVSMTAGDMMTDDAFAPVAVRRPLAAAAPPVPVVPALDETSARRVLPDGIVPELSRRRDCEVEVALPATVPVAALWARAFRPGDGVVVALAPFRPSGRRASSRLLVPPGTAADLVVDLTFDAAAPVTTLLRASTEAALAAGRRAARAHRLGDHYGAARHWRDCETGWGNAGDTTRAAMAAAYAKQPPPGARPLVSDRLAPT